MAVQPSIREKTPQVRDKLLAAACEAMRLLQDRQAHTPIEMLDPREIRVLRLLRSAVRQSVGEGEEALGGHGPYVPRVGNEESS